MTNKEKKTKLKAAKKEIKFMDAIIVGIFIFLLIFIALMIYISLTLSYEPSTLIMSVFGFCGLECGLLANMTNRKRALKKEVEKITAGVALENESPPTNDFVTSPAEDDIVDDYSAGYDEYGIYSIGNEDWTYDESEPESLCNSYDNRNGYSQYYEPNYQYQQELEATFLTPIFIEDIED